MASENCKIITFYLPQYHPIPENNEWWGAGFTDWVKVSTARPRFNGHYQPHVPTDLGFYDLRLEETRLAQAQLGSSYGITGFCYYHYWFNGKRLLYTPLDAVLENKSPGLPFCLCWANENWTRAWDGLERQVLIQQNYTQEDSEQQINWLLNVFKDYRYIKIDGRPLFLIYRLDQIPNIKDMIISWRRAVCNSGFPDIYLCAVKNSFVELEDETILDYGFNGIIDFQPDRRDFPAPIGFKPWLYRTARQILPNSVYQRLKLSMSANNIVSYRNMVEGILNQDWPSTYRKFPCVFPSWDNSARRKSATIIQNDDPALYGKWLKQAIQNIKSYPSSEQFVFINAWNEWAEGCHLEPDARHGKAFLEATLHAVRALNGPDV